MLHITTATFTAGTIRTNTEALWQYDYGQVLKISGLTLPEAYEVHFSNQSVVGTTITQIGNADGVSIPDELLTTGIPIYAYIFLHDEVMDGETEYVITIPVNARPKPSDDVPTPMEQSAITEAIAALNVAVAQTEANVEHYPTVIDGYWYVWNEEQEDWVTTGVKAEGEDGASGVGIQSITKTGTSGLVDTYTILFTDGNSTTFTVTNGRDGETPTIDSSLSTTSENPVQNKVITNALNNKADIIITSASGSIAHIEDAGAYPVVDLKINIEPVQAGSGDPSPDNERPITGWTGANVYSEETYDADADPKISVTWQYEAGTVYWGILNVTTGVLTVTHSLLTVNTANLNGDSTYPGWNGVVGLRDIVGAGLNGIIEGICSITSAPIRVNTQSSNNTIYFAKSQLKVTSDELQAAMPNTDIYFVLKRAENIVYQLTPQQINSILGQNNIWADTGDTAVTYRADTKLYIDKAIAEAIAAI